MFTKNYVRIELYAIPNVAQPGMRVLSNDRDNVDKVLDILQRDKYHILEIAPVLTPEKSRWSFINNNRQFSGITYRYDIKLNDGFDAFTFAEAIIHLMWGYLTCAIEFSPYSDKSR